MPGNQFEVTYKEAAPNQVEVLHIADNPVRDECGPSKSRSYYSNTKIRCMRPSEKFVLTHRLYTFLDEWLFYLVLILLFYTEHYAMMVPVTIYGAIAIYISYKRQWRFEKELFSDS